MTAGVATFHFLGAGPSADLGGPSVSDASIGGADVNRRVPSTISGAGTPSSCAPVVAGASASSMRASVGIGGTVCKSGSEVGDCVVVASGQSVGMPIWLSGLSSSSSSLQTALA
jgi:hypothetical protein